NDYTDVWFIGYTKELVAGVWMGMDQAENIRAGAQGARNAAPPWANFMREVYERRPNPGDWPMPSGAQRLLEAQQQGGNAPTPWLRVPAPPPKPPRTFSRAQDRRVAP